MTERPFRPLWWYILSYLWCCQSRMGEVLLLNRVWNICLPFWISCWQVPRYGSSWTEPYSLCLSSVASIQAPRLLSSPSGSFRWCHALWTIQGLSQRLKNSPDVGRVSCKRVSRGVWGRRCATGGLLFPKALFPLHSPRSRSNDNWTRLFQGW